MACERRSAAASRRAALERLAFQGQCQGPHGVVQQLERVGVVVGVARRQVRHEHRPTLGMPQCDRRQVGRDESARARQLRPRERSRPRR